MGSSDNTMGRRRFSGRVIPAGFWRQYGLSLALACALAAGLLAVFGMRYQVNDDAAISNIAAGAYGPHTQYLIYVNLLIGWCLKPFYALAPGLNWFVVLFFALGLATLALVGVLLLRRLGTGRGLLLYAAFALLAGFDLITVFHYSKYATLFLAVGLLLVALHLGRWGGPTLLGLGLAFLGSLLRFDMLVAVGGMAAPLLLVRFFGLERPAKRRAALAVAALLALCFAAKGADSAAYALTEGWQGYPAFNTVRTELSDYKMGYAADPTALAPAGFSENDFEMIKDWHFAYSPVFETARLEKAAALLPGIATADGLRDAASRLFWSLFGIPVHLLFCGVLAGWLLLGKKRQWPALVGTLAMFGLMVLYLSLRGRYMDRIDYCLVLAAAVFCAACFEPRQQPMDACWLALAAVLLAAAAMPTFNQQHHYAKEYQAERQAGSGAIQPVLEDKDRLYLVDVGWFDAANGYDVWHARPAGSFSNIVFLGGWPARSLHQTEVLAQKGVTDPYADGLAREDIIYIDMDARETLERFLREHYDPGAAIAPTALPFEYGLRAYVFQPGSA